MHVKRLLPASCLPPTSYLLPPAKLPPEKLPAKLPASSKAASYLLPPAKLPPACNKHINRAPEAFIVGLLLFVNKS